MDGPTKRKTDRELRESRIRRGRDWIASRILNPADASTPYKSGSRRVRRVLTNLDRRIRESSGGGDWKQVKLTRFECEILSAYLHQSLLDHERLEQRKSSAAIEDHTENLLDVKRAGQAVVMMRRLYGELLHHYVTHNTILDEIGVEEVIQKLEKNSLAGPMPQLSRESAKSAIDSLFGKDGQTLLKAPEPKSPGESNSGSG